MIKSSNRLTLNTKRLAIFHFKRCKRILVIARVLKIEIFLPVTYFDKYMRGSGDFVCVVSIAKYVCSTVAMGCVFFRPNKESRRKASIKLLLAMSSPGAACATHSTLQAMLVV